MTGKRKRAEKGDISRRDLLRGAGVAFGGVAASTVLSACAPRTGGPATSGGADAELQKAKAHIEVDSTICAGCRNCIMACSLRNEKVLNGELSRTQLKRDVLGGAIAEPLPCKQCDGPECLRACPTGALHVDENTGARAINTEVCIGCQSCVKACIATPPRVRYNAVTNKSFKCDLCGGEPQCVRFCPSGALKYVEVTA
jgi:Fe-S-cluster-containing dehydrogenase component